MAVGALTEGLRGIGDVRWVRAEQYHLTLKFLGDASPEQLEQLAAGLRELSKISSSFVIQLEGVGAFPRMERPRTIWLRVSAGEAPLAALAGEVEAAGVAAGFPREARPFSAHLTLGRVRSTRDLRALAERLRGAAGGPVPPFAVEELLLMESQLRPDGPRYTVRERCRLAGER
jgi:2'-5' RNA ligase